MNIQRSLTRRQRRSVCQPMGPIQARPGLHMAAARPAPSAGPAARQARDDDLDDRADALDDGAEDADDGADDGVQAVSDGAQDRLDL